MAAPAVQVDHLALGDVLRELLRQGQHLAVVRDAAVDDGAMVEAQVRAVHNLDAVQLRDGIFLGHDGLHVFKVRAECTAGLPHLSAHSGLILKRVCARKRKGCEVKGNLTLVTPHMPYLALQTHKLGYAVLQNACDQIKRIIVVL